MKKVYTKIFSITMMAILSIMLILPCSVNAATIEDNAVQPRWYDPTGSWPGYIFVTMDNNKSGWHYGHAGIGGNNGETIEAYSNTNVAIFSNGYNRNWSDCSTGGIYRVNGASTSQYETAKNWAYSQVGKEYDLSLLDGDSKFYCSELVYKAWKAAGITVGTNILGLITPESIMNHNNTILVYSF